MNRGGHELNRVYANAMNPQIADPANLGRRVPMATTPISGGFALQRTGLISQRFKEPRQLMITLMTPTRGPSGVTPWNAAFNGASGVGPTAANFSAPQLPDNNRGLQCDLRWGAGGAAQQTVFDMPGAGTVFGVTADTLDLSVITPNVGSPFVYATQDLVPQVGAWMVDGQAADPTPLRWLETFVGGSQIPASSFKAFAVKPFARKLRVRVLGVPTGGTGNVCALQAVWGDTAGNQLANDELIPTPSHTGATAGAVDVLLDVPGQATVVTLVNQQATATSMFAIGVEWYIGLA